MALSWSMSKPSSKPLVTVSVFLFGKPAWEIDGLEGSPVDLGLLSAIAMCGEELNRRLSRAAEVGKRLVANGWEGYGLLYDVEFYKTITLREAEDELRGMRVEPSEVSMREEVEDQED
jgi:hypothetical protein